MENDCACLIDGKIMLHATIKGDVKIFEFLWSHFTNISIDISSVFICGFVGRYGHLEILKWLHTRGYKWNDEIYQEAALHGKLEILKWLKLNDSEWKIHKSHIIHNAIKANQNFVLLWSLHSECPFSINHLDKIDEICAKIKECKSYCPKCDDIVDNIMDASKSTCSKCNGIVLPGHPYETRDIITLAKIPLYYNE